MDRETAATYLQKGEILKRAGRLKEAIASYRRAIKINPHFSWCYHKLGEALSKRGLLDEAIISFGKAIEINPKSAWSYYELGEVFATKGEFDAAVPNYRRACELEPDFGGFSRGLEIAVNKLRKNNQKKASKYRASAAKQKRLGNLDEAISGYRKAIAIKPKLADYCRLGLLLVEKQEAWNEALFCYEKLLEVQPWKGDRAKLFLSLGVALVKEGKTERVIDSYHKVFEKKIENVFSYARFSIYLSNLGLLKEALAFFDKLPKPNSPKQEKKNRSSDLGDISKYDSIWNWFNRTDPKEFNLKVDSESLKLETDKIREHFQSKKISIFVLPHLTAKDEIFLRELGISAEYVRLMKSENHGLENIYLNAFDDGNSSNSSGYIQRNMLHPHRRFGCWHPIDNPVEFPHTIAEFQHMYALDPMSGKVVKTQESFFLDSLCGLIFYRFKGREIFYLIVGGFNGEKVSLYFPRLNIVINYIDWHALSEKIFQEFQTLTVTYFQDVLNYLNSSKSKNITSLLGFIKNLGHFFWQDLNGVYYSYKNNLLNKINRFAIGHYEPMKLTSILPEIPESKIFKLSEMTAGEEFQFFLKNNCFCFRMTENSIGEECMDRVRKVAFGRCSADFLKMLTDIKEKKQSFPLLWINVRYHNKSWVSQEEGYANIINKLSDDFPNLGIVFDGWIDCDRVVENIQKQLKPNIKTYNTLGCPLHESIVWGYHIDAYIAIVGSGLTITSWLNDKPGVAYANKGHIGQNKFWSRVKEKAIAPTFVRQEDVVDIGTGGWKNYEIKWQVIYNNILPILQKLAK